SASGAPHTLSRLTHASIINGGDGAHEHPTQALLDAYIIRQRKGRLNDLKVAIIGDIAHSRVARSNVHLLTKFGTQVWLCSAPTLMPPGIEKIVCDHGEFLHVTHAMDEAVAQADVIMMLRVQFERMNESFFPSIRHGKSTPLPTSSFAAARFNPLALERAVLCPRTSRSSMQPGSSSLPDSSIFMCICASPALRKQKRLQQAAARR